MNSEELEMSLRTEFESYLKDVSAEMRQEVSELREKVESEIERHKSNLSEIFDAASARAENEREIGADFRESIVEHLRLAKDEGARITATAIAEAEEMQRAEEAAPVAGVKELFVGVNDISSKDSQAEILKSLVAHASHFAARGAFFILKNDYLVGWRMFGTDETVGDETVRDVYLETSSHSVLSEAVRSLAAVESSYGAYSNDDAFLDKLEFGAPDKMYAVPLVARGRGVAVLYADNGANGGSVNVEALETLVRVAGLTVEVLASGRSAARRESVKPAPAAVESVSAVSGFMRESAPATAPENFSRTGSESAVENFEPTYEQSPAFESSSYRDSFEENSFGSRSFESPDAEEEAAPEQETSAEIYDIGEVSAQHAPAETIEKYPSYENSSWEQSSQETVSADVSAQEYAQNFARDTDPGEYVQDYSRQTVGGEGVANDYVADEAVAQPAVKEFEPERFESSSYTPQTEFAVSAPEQNFGSFEIGRNPAETYKAENAERTTSFETYQPISQPAEASPAPVKSRLSERNVDLPIEVNDDERRLHNDARRFARLLVSEIKLYNEQKVREGRENNDLYERLREAIDRSREMYDKRVQSAVAAKFDYFHYELVNTLSEGDASKLGSDYPGATV